jgi:hypothetical protein
VPNQRPTGIIAGSLSSRRTPQPRTACTHRGGSALHFWLRLNADAIWPDRSRRIVRESLLWVVGLVYRPTLMPVGSPCRTKSTRAAATRSRKSDTSDQLAARRGRIGSPEESDGVVHRGGRWRHGMTDRRRAGRSADLFGDRRRRRRVSGSSRQPSSHFFS